MKKLNLVKALFLAGSLLSANAMADVIVLDFEGVNATYPSGSNSFVQDFYNGGTSSEGTSGTNYGIEFSDNALGICLNTIGVICTNTSRGGEGNPDSQLGGLFFLTGNETFMNVAAGFETGFSFFYAAANQGGSISVFDGLFGTGNLLASLTLGVTPGTCGPEYSAGFCTFVAGGVGFDGVAQSVSFAGAANQIVWDDITFGSIIPDPEPNPVPAPHMLLIMALGLVSLRWLRRKA